MEYRFAKLGIHDPCAVESGRFLRLLLASLHDGLDEKGRRRIDDMLLPDEEIRARLPQHPKMHEALGLMASAEYQRVMTDPRSTPAQREKARIDEMQRVKRYALMGMGGGDGRAP